MSAFDMFNVLVVARDRSSRCVVFELTNVREGEAEITAIEACASRNVHYLSCFRTSPMRWPADGK